jgi:hypothetical protein
MVHILHRSVHILLCRILFVNEVLMAFEAALIINFESDSEPTLVNDGGFLTLVPANSSLLLRALFNSTCVGLAYHFTLCVCVSLMMLLNRC